MMRNRLLIVILAVTYVGLSGKTAMARQNPEFYHAFLEKVYEDVRVSPEIPRFLTHARMVDLLQQLRNQAPDLVRLEVVGHSVEGRDLYLVQLGSGPQRLLMWSQMHGDEPTATAALMDVFNFVVQRRTDEFVGDLLKNSTLLVLPMLNPDGAERFTRRNSQGLDINRDARDLSTPEGRTLKAVRDRFQPQFGFNLHDQNSRRTVGRTNKQVAIALMAPPYDWEESDNPVRVRAKQVGSVVYQALGPYVYGHVSRYDAGYMPRAFGDSMQHWGTSTVLVESGGWQERDKRYLVKMNFIALLSAWHAIATGDYADANPALYDALPENDQVLFDLVIREALVIDGSGMPPFITDIGINYEEDAVGDTTVAYRGIIDDQGDMEIFAAKDTIDAAGMVVLPGLVAVDPSLSAGDPALADKLDRYLQKGYVTIVGAADLHPAWGTERKPIEPGASLPIDFGVLLRPPVTSQQMDAAALMQLGSSLQDGALGLLAPKTHPDWSYLSELSKWTGRTLIEPGSLSEFAPVGAVSAEEVQANSSALAARLGLRDRGLIRPGKRADLVFFDRASGGGKDGMVHLGRLRMVLLNGEVVLKDGMPVGTNHGSWLHR